MSFHNRRQPDEQATANPTEITVIVSSISTLAALAPIIRHRLARVAMFARVKSRRLIAISELRGTSPR